MTDPTPRPNPIVRAADAAAPYLRPGAVHPRYAAPAIAMEPSPAAAERELDRIVTNEGNF